MVRSNKTLVTVPEELARKLCRKVRPWLYDTKNPNFHCQSWRLLRAESETATASVLLTLMQVDRAAVLRIATQAIAT